MTELINAKQVNSVLDFEYLIDSLQDAHRKTPAIADDLFLYDSLGTEQQKNCLLARAAWAPGQAVGVKLATVFPANTDRPTTQAAYILFDGENGSLSAVIDGKSLTNKKTAGDSALGSRFLSREDSKVMLLVGAGSLAPDLIEAHTTARPSIEKILVWNRTPSKAHIVEGRFQDSDSKFKVEAIEDLASAASQADIISCATAAHKPILCGDWLKPGTHVDLIGGYNLNMREADDNVIKRSSIFVDSRRTTIGDVGDIQIPIDNGLITEKNILADLYDLSNGLHNGRSSKDEITMFKNGGGGHLDLMTAQAIMSRLSMDTE